MKYPGWELLYRWSMLTLVYACCDIVTQPVAPAAYRVFLALTFTVGLLAAFRVCVAGRHPNE